jgi:hypothetical protein
MYTYIMSHRTQITLTDAQYEHLCRESKRTGLSIAELIRRAVDEKYGRSSVEEMLAAIDASFGAWADRDDWEYEDGAAYVEAIRETFEQRRARYDDRR